MGDCGATRRAMHAQYKHTVLRKYTGISNDTHTLIDDVILRKESFKVE